MLMIDILKKNFFIFCFFLLVAQQFNLFHDTYGIIINSYEKRLEKFYGDCNGISYGFVKKIYKDYNLIEKLKLKEKNIKVENFDDYPSIYGYFYNPKYIDSEKYLILLNLEKKSLEKKFNNYKIILNKNNCYLIKND